MTEYDSTATSDTQPRKTMTIMGNVDTFDLMMGYKLTINI